MRLVLQRVSEASVTIEGTIHGAINHGLVVLIGIADGDTREDADWLVGKLLQMRIFPDEDGKMNRSLMDCNGELLLISQFTLHASTKKGNRPSFIAAARPETAIPLYDYFVEQCRESGAARVATGIFAADMKVALINDGPVTIVMDSKQRE